MALQSRENQLDLSSGFMPQADADCRFLWKCGEEVLSLAVAGKNKLSACETAASE